MENYFYLVIEGKFLIADPEFCADSDRSFDIKTSDLSQDGFLLEKLNLVSMYHNDPEYAFPFFCSYLSSFGSPSVERCEKLRSDPTLRVLLTNDNLFHDIFNYLTEKNKKIA